MTREIDKALQASASPAGVTPDPDLSSTPLRPQPLEASPHRAHADTASPGETETTPARTHVTMGAPAPSRAAQPTSPSLVSSSGVRPHGLLESAIPGASAAAPSPRLMASIGLPHAAGRAAAEPEVGVLLSSRGSSGSAGLARLKQIGDAVDTLKTQNVELLATLEQRNAKMLELKAQLDEELAVRAEGEKIVRAQRDQIAELQRKLDAEQAERNADTARLQAQLAAVTNSHSKDVTEQLEPAYRVNIQFGERAAREQIIAAGVQARRSVVAGTLAASRATRLEADQMLRSGAGTARLAASTAGASEADGLRQENARLKADLQRAQSDLQHAQRSLEAAGKQIEAHDQSRRSAELRAAEATSELMTSRAALRTGAETAREAVREASAAAELPLREEIANLQGTLETIRTSAAHAPSAIEADRNQAMIRGFTRAIADLVARVDAIDKAAAAKVAEAKAAREAAASELMASRAQGESALLTSRQASEAATSAQAMVNQLSRETQRLGTELAAKDEENAALQAEVVQLREAEASARQGIAALKAQLQQVRDFGQQQVFRTAAERDAAFAQLLGDLDSAQGSVTEAAKRAATARDAELAATVAGITADFDRQLQQERVEVRRLTAANAAKDNALNQHAEQVRVLETGRGFLQTQLDQIQRERNILQVQLDQIRTKHATALAGRSTQDPTGGVGQGADAAPLPTSRGLGGLLGSMFGRGDGSVPPQTPRAGVGSSQGPQGPGQAPYGHGDTLEDFVGPGTNAPGMSELLVGTFANVADAKVEQLSPAPAQFSRTQPSRELRVNLHGHGTRFEYGMIRVSPSEAADDATSDANSAAATSAESTSLAIVAANDANVSPTKQFLHWIARSFVSGVLFSIEIYPTSTVTAPVFAALDSVLALPADGTMQRLLWPQPVSGTCGQTLADASARFAHALNAGPALLLPAAGHAGAQPHADAPSSDGTKIYLGTYDDQAFVGIESSWGRTLITSTNVAAGMQHANTAVSVTHYLVEPTSARFGSALKGLARSSAIRLPASPVSDYVAALSIANTISSDGSIAAVWEVGGIAAHGAVQAVISALSKPLGAAYAMARIVWSGKDLVSHVNELRHASFDLLQAHVEFILHGSQKCVDDLKLATRGELSSDYSPALRDQTVKYIFAPVVESVCEARSHLLTEKISQEHANVWINSEKARLVDLSNQDPCLDWCLRLEGDAHATEANRGGGLDGSYLCADVCGDTLVSVEVSGGKLTIGA